MKILRSTIVAAAFVIGFSPHAGAQGMANIVRLLRPEVLKQLNGDMVRLVNELPEVDHQNKAIVGRLFAHGGLGHAKLGKDGVYRSEVRVPSGEFIWRPAIIVMGHGGDLELEFKNSDAFSHHAAILPSNGGKVYLELPQNEKGVARLHLDAPGYYWFGCPVADHAGRGMLGLIVVKGEVPEEARLDRPLIAGMRKRDEFKGTDEEDSVALLGDDRAAIARAHRSERKGAKSQGEKR
jgi:PQQ system protein